MISVDADIIIESNTGNLKVTGTENTVTFNFSNWKVYKELTGVLPIKRKLLKHLKEDLIIKVDSNHVVSVKKGKLKNLSFTSLFRLVRAELSKRLF